MSRPATLAPIGSTKSLRSSNKPLNPVPVLSQPPKPIKSPKAEALAEVTKADIDPEVMAQLNPDLLANNDDDDEQDNDPPERALEYDLNDPNDPRNESI